MVKRKPRKKLIKTVDILRPIDINIIGDKKDPCFGKHYSPKAEECQRCGDSEICAIIKSQKLSVKRAELETTQKFKDLEQAGLKTPDKKLIRKMVRKRILELIRLNGERGISSNKLVEETHVVFFTRGYTRERIKKIIGLMVDKTSKFTLNSKTDTYKWKTN